MTRSGRIVAVVGLVLGTLGLQAVASHAAGNQAITVTDCAGQYGNGGTVGSPASGSLQSAINTATADTGDTISFRCGGTAPFTISISSTLGISSSMTIDGGGNVTLDGGKSVRLISVTATGNLTLQRLTLQHGKSATYGGAIDNQGGTVSISSSTLSDNSVSFDNGEGGAIYNTGTVTITSSTLSDNSSPASGGAISNDRGGRVTITGSTLAGNLAVGIGGAIESYVGTVTITNSDLSGNTGGYGGAIWNDDSVSISSSTLSGNTGGDSNTAGGAIDNQGGTMTISSSSLSGNSDGGDGGAIYTGAGTVTITSSTLSGNSASSGGAISNAAGGTVIVGASIIAKNAGGNCNSTRVGVSITDQGYNLESGTDCGFTGTGSKQNIDPKLDPKSLQNNGGPTQTLALQSTSPAIDQIPLGTLNCAAGGTDQRGQPRPDTGESACDIGAYEFTDPSQPIIRRADVQHQVRGKWTSTRTVRRGEKVRFALTWTTTAGSSTKVTATLQVVRGKAVVSRPSSKTQSIKSSGSSGTFNWGVSFGAKVAPGGLVARFTVQTAAAVSKSVTFRVSK